MQEALSAWSTAHQPRHVVYRIVGGQWDPRTHDLRDGLANNGVPFEFHMQDSDIGRQLMQAHQIDPTRLPAVITHDGTVLHQPSMTDLAAHLGVKTQPGTPAYVLVVLGAGPVGEGSVAVGSVHRYLAELEPFVGQAK